MAEIQDSDINLTASNISEILNNNIKNLNTSITDNNSIYKLLLKNIYLVVSIIILLIGICTYYYYQYKNKNIEDKLKNKNNELFEQQQLNKLLQNNNIKKQQLIDKHENKMNKIIEGINNNNDLNVVNNVPPVVNNVPPVVNNVPPVVNNVPPVVNNNLDVEEDEEIVIDTDDILKNIEILDESDSDNLEDENIKELNLSVKEMENINNVLFNN